MKKVFFLRIDDRFIHGQVGVAWISYVGADEMVLLNDKLSADPLASIMQKMSAATTKVTIKSMEEGIDYLKTKKIKKLDNLFVIVSCPQDALKLIEAGFAIEHINIGHTAHRDDSVEVYSCLFIGEAELAAFQELERKGVDLDFRLVPSHKKPKLNFSQMKI